MIRARRRKAISERALVETMMPAEDSQRVQIPEALAGPGHGQRDLSELSDTAGRKARKLQPLGAALCLLSAMTMIAVLAWVIASVSERSASTLTDADRVEAFRPAAATGAD